MSIKYDNHNSIRMGEICPKEKYLQKLQHLQDEEKTLLSKAKKYPLSRLILGFTAVIAIYFSIAEGWSLAIILSPISVISFTIVVVHDFRNKRKLAHCQKLIEICHQELDALKGNINHFNDGKEFIDQKHHYSHDLDIFGENSIFQFLNRTTGNEGQNTLANYLKQPSETEDILLRQRAIKELGEKLDWRMNFRAVGLLHQSGEEYSNMLVQWLEEEQALLSKTWLKMIIFILPGLTVLSILFAIFSSILWPFYLFLIIQISILWRHKDQVAIVFDKTSRQESFLRSYSELIAAVETENFQSELLCKLKMQLEEKDSSASSITRRLSRILNYMEFRSNFFVHIPLNLVFLWDLQWLIQLEIWKYKYANKIKLWFSTIAEFEAIASLATIYFNNPEWIFPEISSEHFVLNGSKLGHPLISHENRVTNPVNLSKKGQVMLVTGSNMAGKSTYLRTIGVNVVLALCGAPVCAGSLKLSPIKLVSSMRISDSLEENTSSFYAELKKLKTVIELVKKYENTFFLLDEILRGTNSHDRHTGSGALIRQMIGDHGNGIIATHDLALTELHNEFPGKLLNFSFDVQVENDQLFFDYKLHPGVCKSLNATLLMKKMGIRM